MGTADLLNTKKNQGIKLYIKRVFISEDPCLLPKYMRFIRGIIDSKDLPLNISRENLQNNNTLRKIKSSITNKILNVLLEKREKNINEYYIFWSNFGSILKEGLCEINSSAEKILKICIFRSALYNKMVSLDDYISIEN